MGAAHPLSIFLLVRSLETGGAERQLTQLAIGLHHRGHDVRVGVFYRRGPLARELERAGIVIIDLKKNGRWDLVGFLIRLRHQIRKTRPDVIYSFLGGANIIAGALRLLVPRLKIAWSVRSSDMDLSRYDWTHRLAARMEQFMSFVPDTIIANSSAGSAVAVARRFPADRIEVIPNGIDTKRFRPDPPLRKRQRNEWGLCEGQIAVGILARLDPMKDHPNFLRAAAQLSRVRPELHFVCAGDGPERRELELLAKQLGIAGRVLFAGEAEPAAALNAFDLLCSSSITEGFPNAVAEAMACGVPCIVTDVGDSALIVGDTGTIVAPRAPESLALGILKELELLGTERRTAARQRIVDNFSVDAMVERTLHLLCKAVTAGHSGGKQGPGSLAGCAE